MMFILELIKGSGLKVWLAVFLASFLATGCLCTILVFDLNWLVGEADKKLAKYLSYAMLATITSLSFVAVHLAYLRWGKR